MLAFVFQSTLSLVAVAAQGCPTMCRWPGPCSRQTKQQQSRRLRCPPLLPQPLSVALTASRGVLSTRSRLIADVTFRHNSCAIQMTFLVWRFHICPMCSVA